MSTVLVERMTVMWQSNVTSDLSFFISQNEMIPKLKQLLITKTSFEFFDKIKEEIDFILRNG